MGFTTTTRMSMRLLCDQASYLVHKESEHQEENQRQGHNSALLRVVSAVITDDMSHIVGEVIEGVCQLLDCDRVGFFIVDEITEELWCMDSTALSGFRVPIGREQVYSELSD